MDIYEKLHSGDLYLPSDEKLFKKQLSYQDDVFAYNQIKPSDLEKRRELLNKMFADIGEGCYVEAPFYSNWGGRHVHFGKHVYANYSLYLVDDTHIYVGDYTQFGPNVQLITAAHPKDHELRKKGYQYNLPVRIGSNCWLGAGVMVLPGVTIGDNVIIGAGSIVTKDIPSNVIAYGIPCRVINELN